MTRDADDPQTPQSTVPAAPGAPGTPGEAPPEPQGDRGDLHESGLGRLMLRGGDVFRDYGNWIVVALVALAVIVWVYRLQSRAAEQAQVAARQGVYALAQVVGQAEALSVAAPALDAATVGERAGQIDTDFANAAAVLRESDDDAVAARGLRLRGDYHWNLARLPAPRTVAADDGDAPPLPEPGDSLDSAAAAYERVVSEYPGQGRAVRAALFGLAAVAEERGDFDAAAARYGEVLDRPDLTPLEERTAQARRRLLAYLRPEPRLAPPATRPASPASLGSGSPLQDEIDRLLSGGSLTQPDGGDDAPMTLDVSPTTRPDVP